MSQNKMLMLEYGLMDKIDEMRSDLSRAEFIQLCVDNYLDEAPHNDSSTFRYRPSRSGNLGSAGPVYLEEDLIDRMDSQRGGHGRADFIEMAVNACLDKLKEREPRAKTVPAEYASRNEFEDCRKRLDQFAEGYDRLERRARGYQAWTPRRRPTQPDEPDRVLTANGRTARWNFRESPEETGCGKAEKAPGMVRFRSDRGEHVAVEEPGYEDERDARYPRTELASARNEYPAGRETAYPVEPRQTARRRELL